MCEPLWAARLPDRTPARSRETGPLVRGSRCPRPEDAVDRPARNPRGRMTSSIPRARAGDLAGAVGPRQSAFPVAAISKRQRRRPNSRILQRLLAALLGRQRIETYAHPLNTNHEMPRKPASLRAESNVMTPVPRRNALHPSGRPRAKTASRRRHTPCSDSLVASAGQLFVSERQRRIQRDPCPVCRGRPR